MCHLIACLNQLHIERTDDSGFCQWSKTSILMYNIMRFSYIAVTYLRGIELPLEIRTISWDNISCSVFYYQMWRQIRQVNPHNSFSSGYYCQHRPVDLTKQIRHRLFNQGNCNCHCFEGVLSSFKTREHQGPIVAVQVHTI